MTDERETFDAWWTGAYGPVSIRAEWPQTHTDAAWMAWQARGEEIERLRAGGCARDQGTTQYCAEAASLAAEVERLRVENIQMQAALGYGILAEDERHIIPTNPYKCGTCDASRRLRAENERLRSELNARCPVDAMERGMSSVEAAVWHVWGDRCSDFEPECLTCKAWDEFDRTKRLEAVLAENMAKDCGVYTAARDEYRKAMAEQAKENERLRAGNDDMRHTIHQWEPDKAALRGENERLRAALERVMIGGNHLVSIIGVTHPQAGTHYNAALEFYGPGHQYDAWCCWNAIMLVRAALAQGGDK